MKHKALIAPLIAIVGFLLSPDFYHVLPDKYAHFVEAFAVLMATFMPSLFHKSTKNVTEAELSGEGPTKEVKER